MVTSDYVKVKIGDDINNDANIIRCYFYKTNKRKLGHIEIMKVLKPMISQLVFVMEREPVIRGHFSPELRDRVARRLTHNGLLWEKSTHQKINVLQRVEEKQDSSGENYHSLGNCYYIHMKTTFLAYGGPSSASFFVDDDMEEGLLNEIVDGFVAGREDG